MVGSYMGRVFTVSSQRILTPSNLKGRDRKSTRLNSSHRT